MGPFPRSWRRSWRCSVRSSASPALALLLGGTGCASTLGRGAELYHRGQIIDAEALLEAREESVKAAPSRVRAIYAAYRGLALLELGDLPRARSWLSEAHVLDRKEPGALRGELRARVDAAWRDLWIALPDPETSGRTARVVP
jgi:hypothetical protein